jgi:hypothetical protein
MGAHLAKAYIEHDLVHPPGKAIRRASSFVSIFARRASASLPRE